MYSPLQNMWVMELVIKISLLQLVVGVYDETNIIMIDHLIETNLQC